MVRCSIRASAAGRAAAVRVSVASAELRRLRGLIAQASLVVADSPRSGSAHDADAALLADSPLFSFGVSDGGVVPSPTFASSQHKLRSTSASVVPADTAGAETSASVAPPPPRASASASAALYRAAAASKSPNSGALPLSPAVIGEGKIAAAPEGRGSSSSPLPPPPPAASEQKQSSSSVSRSQPTSPARGLARTASGVLSFADAVAVCSSAPSSPLTSRRSSFDGDGAPAAAHSAVPEGETQKCPPLPPQPPRALRSSLRLQNQTRSLSPRDEADAAESALSSGSAGGRGGNREEQQPALPPGTGSSGGGGLPGSFPSTPKRVVSFKQLAQAMVSPSRSAGRLEAFDTGERSESNSTLGGSQSGRGTAALNLAAARFSSAAGGDGSEGAMLPPGSPLPPRPTGSRSSLERKPPSSSARSSLDKSLAAATAGAAGEFWSAPIAVSENADEGQGAQSPPPPARQPSEKGGRPLVLPRQRTLQEMMSFFHECALCPPTFNSSRHSSEHAHAVRPSDARSR